METVYKTKGTCSTQIKLDMDGDIIKSVSFTGGCNGNLQGVSRLVEGMKAQDAISKLEGIKCGFKQTSCPDQLAKALRQAVNA
ncbi:MAG: TIGR03905 family TSCPD domain-containing protein [Butyrivibrio sp.]|uniref:TIGR03905 family TSCPD domain-containing protein n=1 Tax=Butyrivibrio sp. TaxID=28121 RepID=UPI0025FFDA3F|nr:TIGR03905 family TSCPD domain-containing protein [Butyrivibrio sp.]MCR5772508.1 TIGR03905 family TSCPD domain-containing protein [Butyrivibrio sp.]